MPTIDLPHGTVSYRSPAQPRPPRRPSCSCMASSSTATLWNTTAEALAAAGVRSYAPDWPLGVASDRAAPGRRPVARVAWRGRSSPSSRRSDLEDVTLVGNDTGGALCQFVIDADPSRVGRLVLTNCDAFDEFPPAPFDKLFKAFRRPRAIRR